MLVLSRKPGEKLMIGDNVEVSVVAIRPGKVRLGISAPRDVAIFRDELLRRLNGDEGRIDRDAMDPTLDRVT